MIRLVNKTFQCFPGKCSSYSSVGYELLGFVLAAVTTSTGKWDDYN